MTRQRRLRELWLERNRRAAQKIAQLPRPRKCDRRHPGPPYTLPCDCVGCRYRHRVRYLDISGLRSLGMRSCFSCWHPMGGDIIEIYGRRSVSFQCPKPRQRQRILRTIGTFVDGVQMDIFAGVRQGLYRFDPFAPAPDPDQMQRWFERGCAIAARDYAKHQRRMRRYDSSMSPLVKRILKRHDKETA